MKEMIRTPGPPPSEIRARLRQMRHDPWWFFADMAERYGDIVYWRAGSKDSFFLNHPEYARDVLATNSRKFVKGIGAEQVMQITGAGLFVSEGDEHRRQRRIVNPAFHHERVLAYGAVMSEITARAVERWEDGQKLDMYWEMMQLTLAVVAKAVFGVDFQRDEARQLGQALAQAQVIFNLPTRVPVDTLSTPVARQIQLAIEELDRVVYRIIEDHHQAGEDRGDLLSALLLAQEGEERLTSRREVRDQTVTMLLAGHDTTATTLTWALYLLSQNPEVQVRLQREVDTVLGGLPPTVDDWPRLTYPEMVFKEALRLYPPVWMLKRRALVDHEIDGHFVPAGAEVAISPFVMGRTPRWYPDPLRFDPDRWTPEAEAARSRWCYFPFGGGPRVCVGEGFAMMEAALILAALAQRWEVRLAPGHPVEFWPGLILRPRHGMEMTVHRRPGS